MSKGEKKKIELIKDYQEAAKKYKLENKELEQQIKDIKMTLNLNQNLLYDYIIKSSGDSEEAKSLVNNTKKIWEETQSLIEKKNLFEIKIARLQELIEDTPTKIREEINNITLKNNKAQEEINEKDKIIKKLKIELDKTRKNALFKNAKNEIYVTEPSKANIESIQEVIGLKSILSKVNPIQSKKKEDSEKLKKEVEELREKLNKMIEKAYDIHNRMNLKKDSILKSTFNKKREINNLLNSIEGYDINADKIEEENEDDEDEEDNNANNTEDSDSEGNEENENNKKKLKEKEKELEKLTEQYKKLKNECQEYEKKINEHKKIYKDIKQKMKNLKESVN